MATREDADLIVKLLHWSTDLGVDEALRTIFSPGFDPESARMDDPAVSKVLFFGETVSTLVKHDVLDGDLVRDLLWVEGIWDRVGVSARAAREESGEPRLYENFEALVARVPQ
jgi:hypothetical protein